MGLGKGALGLNSMGFFPLLAVGPRVSSMHTLGLGFLAREMGDEETALQAGLWDEMRCHIRRAAQPLVRSGGDVARGDRSQVKS